MSWQRGSGAPAERAPHAGAPLQPQQAYGNQQNMYSNYQSAPVSGAAPAQYWPAQQPLYSGQYGQVYQPEYQQDYSNNSNQFYQQQQYNQHNNNHLPPQSVSPASFPNSSAMPPAPPVSSMNSAVEHSSAMGFLPPPASSMLPPSMPPSGVEHSVSATGLLPPPSSILPPTSFPSSSTTNPFKQQGPYSHKKVPSSSPSLQSFFPSPASPSLMAGAGSLQAPQHVLGAQMQLGFGANLETTPDNSERPDQPQMSAFRPMPVAQQIPDNLEVAPQNDRNEYMQTAHLSSADYGENTDFSQPAPPPGLRRMVLGQHESEYSQSLNHASDEPPPGLARMVPGQHTEADSSYRESHIEGQLAEGRPFRQADGQQTPEPYPRPRGLERQVPGESAEYAQFQSGNYGEPRVVPGGDCPRVDNVDGSDYSEPTPRSLNRNVLGAPEQDVASPEPSHNQEELQRNVDNSHESRPASSVDMPPPREQTLEGAVSPADGGRSAEPSEAVERPPSERHPASPDAAPYSQPGEAYREGRMDGQPQDLLTSYRRDGQQTPDGQAAPGVRRPAVPGEASQYGGYAEERVAPGGAEAADAARQLAALALDDARHAAAEGENSQDLSTISSVELSFSREPAVEAPRVAASSPARSSGSERGAGRGSARRGERPRADERRPERRREREDSPRRRRPPRDRYDTEDTDYYSDRERERRRYREGSYASKPPRGDERRRYNTIERDRREEPRRRREPRHRAPDAHAHAPPHAPRAHRAANDDPRRRGVAHSSPSRPGSREERERDGRDARDGRETGASDEEREERRRQRRERRRDPRRERPRDHDEHYYEAGGYGSGYDPYALQRQQYQYYEQLRRSDPAAYMAVYRQLLAGRAPPPPPHFRAGKLYDVYGLGYEGREERGSVHSGRSSANGLKGTNDTEVTTDASLNLQLEEAAARSERMTPCKFSTAHVKGSIASHHIVVVRPSYPVDGLPATVQLLSLAAASQRDPRAARLLAAPGPLVKGVTHKKSVVDYCEGRARTAAARGGRDPAGQALLWELLALLLRQNGVVVGTDIAELLMKSAREHEHAPAPARAVNHAGAGAGSRRGSALSRDSEPRAASPRALHSPDPAAREDSVPPVDQQMALDRLREYLTYGNRQDALEWCMSTGLWGHALQLAAHCERRVRAAAAARFLAHVPRRDPLHTLYAHLQAHTPPAATCVADERWGDWRPHAAIMLSNSSSKPDTDRGSLVQLGDSLASRGLLFSAQFCYVAAGVQPARHPLAPLQPAQAAGAGGTPRLALLLADPRAASLAELASDDAIFATEVYEYALSLNHDYVLDHLQVYKLIMATRLVDIGAYERALRYVEAAAAAVTRAPRAHSAQLVRQLAALADRLQHHDPAPDDAPGSGEPSPRHQWLRGVQDVADMLQAEAEAASQHSTPQHAPDPAPPAYGWDQQSQQLQQQQQYPQYGEQEESPDYSQYYQQQPEPAPAAEPAPAPPAAAPPAAPAALPAAAPDYADEWARHDEHAQSYGDLYWQDQPYSYGESADAAARPMITMPGSAPAASHYDHYDDDLAAHAAHAAPNQPAREAESPPPKKGDKKDDKAKSGWFGGILTKLSLRPPNQMILPDDKNPSIVWDEQQKRWRSVDGGDEDVARAPPPPPQLNMSSGVPPAPGAPAPPGGPGAPPVSNIFKMQKGRHIKNSYVDVLNPGGGGGGAPRPAPPAAALLPPAPAAAPLTYFVPGAAPAPAPAPAQGHYDERLEPAGDQLPSYHGGI